MKRILAVLLAALLLLALLPGCGAGGETPETAEVPETQNGQEEKRDATGAYVLNDRGEAVVDDAALRPAVATDDNYRVFYEIFVGSFSDSNGDGVGDLRGIINRMDYLNDGDDNSGVSLLGVFN